jgi:tRNA-uridine 2-sulfurtransferase
MKKIVYLMLSGGVDSSVAAVKLLEKGYEVRAVFMHCFSEEELVKLGLNPQDYACSWDEDSRDAQVVATKLGISFEIWDLRKEYFDSVVSYMISEYSNGKTPNPDVMCNSFIKFGVFATKAFEKGADFVATGHYAKVEFCEKYSKNLVLRADDSFKDQSYFLSRINPKLLDKVLFPIGELESKAEVRKVALEHDLVTASKPDSQGICFIGDTPLRKILIKTLGEKPGDIINRADGKKLGAHNGAFQYTIGQRFGLHLSNGPWFVSAIDVEKNIVIVSHHTDSNDLLKTELTAHKLTFFIEKDCLTNTQFDIQIRYRQKPVPGFVSIQGDTMSVAFTEPIRAISPGQIVTIYDQEKLVCSGIIV